jgi:hypothetical protein
LQTNVASPTQLASNSDLTGVSDSSNSPQTPQTPQMYRRMRPRYPQELGRVPLHRRGTSKTYERLEDLLKEAGYKETRIFTPETERTGKCEDDDDDATVVEDKRTSMVKDVVGFLTGLIPGVGASVAGSGAESVGSKILDPSTGSQTRGTNNPSSQPSAISFSEQSCSPASVASWPTSASRRPTSNTIKTSANRHSPYDTACPGTTSSITKVVSFSSSSSSAQTAPHSPPEPHGLGLIPGSNTHIAPPHTTTNLTLRVHLVRLRTCATWPRLQT